MYRTGIILFLFAGLAFAKTILNSDVYSNFTKKSLTNNSEGLELLSILDNSSTATTVNNDDSNSEYNSESEENLTTTIRAVNIDGSNSEDESEDESETESVCKLSEEPPEPGSKCCGIDVSSRTMIFGGEPTLLNYYPWLALIEYLSPNGNLRVACGGNLISNLYVLTAAHCVYTVEMPWYVLLGVHNRSHSCVQSHSGKELCPEGMARIRIEKIVPHRYYVDKDDKHDIALLKLKNTAPYTVSIRPICLPKSDLNQASTSLHNNLRLTAAGWGITVQYWKQTDYLISDKPAYVLVDSAMSDVKRHVQLPYVPLEVCANSWNVTPFVVCAGGENGKDACRGDSGGPLMFSKDGQFELTGISSYGSTRCGTGSPGVFTNIFKYISWIEDVIKYGDTE